MTELAPAPAAGAANATVANGSSGPQASSGCPPTGPPFESALGAELARTASAEGQEAEQQAGDRRRNDPDQAQALTGAPALAAATLAAPAPAPRGDQSGPDGEVASAAAATPTAAAAPSLTTPETASTNPGPVGPVPHSAETQVDPAGAGLPTPAPEAESAPPVADAEPSQAGANPVADERPGLSSATQGISAQIGSRAPALTPSPEPTGPGTPGQAQPAPAQTGGPASDPSPVLRRDGSAAGPDAGPEGQPSSIPGDQTVPGVKRTTATSTRSDATAEADPAGARQDVQPTLAETPTSTTAPAPSPAAPPTTSPAASSSTYGVDLNQAIEQAHTTIELAARQGLAQARIQLVPAELGAIRIHLTQTAAGLLARVSADSAAASQALAAAHAELRQSLSGAGIELTHLHVGTHDAATGDAGGHRPGEQAAGGPGADPREPGATTGGQDGGVDARTGQAEASDEADRADGAEPVAASQNVQATEASEAEHEAYAPGVLVDVLA